jgi:acyl-CoA reductase-like NAD-dependent aldehyde dehydrogenase
MMDHAADRVAATLAAARVASRDWAGWPVHARLAVIARARRLLARDAEALAAALSDLRPAAETLVAEVLPLAEAARFLERRAAALLAPRRLHGGRPLWLLGVQAEIRREPAGVVLVLGPSNYPLFLPGAQVLQALAAGNAVCAKPAPGCTAILEAFAAILTRAGLPDGVLHLLDPEAGQAAVRAGFDHIVLTGSATTGRRVLADAAAMLTPATMELSGSDAVFVLPGADLDLVAAVLAYGLRLNGGATCIAPRRVFATPADAAALETRLLALVASIPPARVTPAVRARLDVLLAEAEAAGARVLGGLDAVMTPVIVADATPGLRLLREDVFAPVLSFVPASDMEAALQADALCPYALGASIFGPQATAYAFAARVRAGSVVVNDLIVPTADPRLPFGGRGESGFGSTRGAEGLLELTRIKTVSIRTGRTRPHLAPAQPNDRANFTAMLQLLHGSAADKFQALRRLARRGRA